MQIQDSLISPIFSVLLFWMKMLCHSLYDQLIALSISRTHHQYHLPRMKKKNENVLNYHLLANTYHQNFLIFHPQNYANSSIKSSVKALFKILYLNLSTGINIFEIILKVYIYERLYISV